MQKRFVVFDEERARQTVQTIDAENEDQLWGEIAHKFGRENWIKEDVGRMAYDQGLMEGFCRDEVGDLFDNATKRQLRPDLAAQFGGESSKGFQNYFKQCVEANVRAYFGTRQDFAELYLQKWLNPESTELPDELYEFCFLKDTRYGTEPSYIVIHEVGVV